MNISFLGRFIIIAGAEIETIMKAVLRDPEAEILSKRIDGLRGQFGVTGKQFMVS